MQAVLTLLIFVLVSIMITIAGVGATLIITKSKLFAILQNSFDYKKNHTLSPESKWNGYWNTLFNCPMCMGFWVGLVFQSFGIWAVYSFLNLAMPNFAFAVFIIMQGCITSLFSMWVYMIWVKLNFHKL